MTKMKKIALIAVCAMLLVCVTIGATVAYLTSTDKVENTFAVGKVKITLDEAQVDTEGNPAPGTDANPNPRVKENSYKLMPGHTYTKDPTVTVKAPSEESYVRLKVTFNNASKIIALCTDPEFAGEITGVENAFPLICMVNFVEANAAKWEGIIPDNMLEMEDMLADAKYFVEGTDTLTYYFYYKTTVAAPTADVKLPVLFNTITVPEWATGAQLDALNNFKITAVAEAIQADGFDTADAAWAAYNG